MVRWLLKQELAGRSEERGLCQSDMSTCVVSDVCYKIKRTLGGIRNPIESGQGGTYQKESSEEKSEQYQIPKGQEEAS